MHVCSIVVLISFMAGIGCGLFFSEIESKSEKRIEETNAAYYYCECADKFHDQCRFKQALTCYDRAVILKVGKKNLELYLVARGGCYEKLGEYEKAEKDYTQAITVNPAYSVAYFVRGELRQRQGNQAGERDLIQSERLANAIGSEWRAHIIKKHPEINLREGAYK